MIKIALFRIYYLKIVNYEMSLYYLQEKKKFLTNEWNIGFNIFIYYLIEKIKVQYGSL